jgi:hypothetical protein
VNITARSEGFLLQRNEWPLARVRSDKEIELNHAAADRSIEPGARRWMEQGTLAFADPKQIEQDWAARGARAPAHSRLTQSDAVRIFDHYYDDNHRKEALK